MPKVWTLDFETYYDREYSLSRMMMEEYIIDPRFEVILVSAKPDDGPTIWHTGTKQSVKQWLLSLELHKSAMVAHNLMFDALILQHHFSIRPGVALDTMSMAQAFIRPFTTGVSLKKCLEHTALGIEKGDEVHNMAGRSRQSLSMPEMQKYAKYCCNDSDGTYQLFRHLLPLFPRTELEIIDQTMRMYLEPTLELDSRLLAEILQEEKAKKVSLMEQVSHVASKDQLMSNDKFALVLQGMGIEPPRKVSPTTKKPTWAFAKGDPEFKALIDEFEDDELVSAVIDARLGIKSTIGETRAQRLLDMSLRSKPLRVPLGYYRAHTGRYGGMERINLQNPPRVTKSRLRYAMRAPKGHVVLAADLSQIEARIVAWLAGATILLEGFRNKEDVYSDFAAHAYKTPTVKGRSKADDARRFVGKTCILGLGYGMGAPKLKTTLNRDNVKISLAGAQTLVYTYRDLYTEIPALWNFISYWIPAIANGERRTLGPLSCGKDMILLPNGMPLQYSHMRKDPYLNEWVYTYGRETRRMFGGKLVENIVQALARIVVMDNMLTIKRELGLRMAMQVHDELDYVVPERDAKEHADAITEIMSVPPAWAPDLPVAVEVAYGPTFGDCK